MHGAAARTTRHGSLDVDACPPSPAVVASYNGFVNSAPARTAYLYIAHAPLTSCARTHAHTHSAGNTATHVQKDCVRRFTPVV
jgi:hypothetical protein